MSTPPGPPPLPEPARDQPPAPPVTPAPDGPAPGTEAGQDAPGGTAPGAGAQGYGTPGYGTPPGYGAPPPYGYGNAPGYPPYQPGPRPGTDGFAIAGFVLSFFGGLSILGAIFSIIALNRIKRSGQRGRGLAIAGLVIFGFWVAIFAIAIAVAVAQGPARDTTGAVRTPTSIDVNDLKVGDCLTTIPSETSDVRDVDATPCTSPSSSSRPVTSKIAP